MNQKVIKAVLRKKIDSWANTIEDPKVKAAVKRDTIVTGGAIASMLLNEEVKDFDVYFSTKETTELVAKYYVNKFNSHPKRSAKAEVISSMNKEAFLKELNDLDSLGYRTSLEIQRRQELEDMVKDLGDRVKIFVKSKGVASIEDGILDSPFEDAVEELNKVKEELTADQKKNHYGPYRPLFLSSNAITLSDDIQIVTRFFGNAEEIHKNFDFVHATNYWTSGNSQLVLKPEALECLLTKELKYRGSKYPLCSIIRMRKFINRGFHINAGEILKMCMNLNEFDLTDVDTLSDQTTGVDSAYFSQVIDGLRTHAGTNGNFKIDRSYVSTILTKVFG
jgi:hypothetical protein